MRRWRFLVERFILQWHLSENCNLKCLHCYQESHIPIQLEFEKLKNIYNQYKDLLKSLDMKGHINITGGEPLCNPHLFDVLDLIKEDSDLITFSILTNGTLITKGIAEKIKSYNPYYVQVSLEGGRRMNDFIRGKGTYKKIAEGITNLRKQGIFTSISFTASSLNYKEFPKVVKYAKKYDVNNVWSDRYIPLGESADRNLVLNHKQCGKYLKIMKKQREKSKIVSMNRALQFQEINGFAYGCNAGDKLLTVMENGDLVPCRRMPIRIGNLFEENMIDLYNNSEILNKLREKTVPEDCNKCQFSDSCNGGLKCLNYALYGDWKCKDIGCQI